MSSSVSPMHPNALVLQNFQCPFEEDPTSLCSYYQMTSLSQSQSTSSPEYPCPFGHQLDILSTDDSKITLQELPSYICVKYLVDQCANTDVVENELPLSGLSRCSDGFHPQISDLIEQEQLHQKMAFVIMEFDKKCSLKGKSNQTQNTNTEETECAICFESIAAKKIHFGIQENCFHHFCGNCLIRWHANNISCPTCRIDSPRILVSKEVIKNSDEKTHYFDEQYRCFEQFYGILARTSTATRGTVSRASVTTARSNTAAATTRVSTTTTPVSRPNAPVINPFSNIFTRRPTSVSSAAPNAPRSSMYSFRYDTLPMTSSRSSNPISSNITITPGSIFELLNSSVTSMGSTSNTMAHNNPTSLPSSTNYNSNNDFPIAPSMQYPGDLISLSPASTHLYDDLSASPYITSLVNRLYGTADQTGPPSYGHFNSTTANPNSNATNSMPRTMPQPFFMTSSTTTSPSRPYSFPTASNLIAQTVRSEPLFGNTSNNTSVSRSVQDEYSRTFLLPNLANNVSNSSPVQTVQPLFGNANRNVPLSHFPFITTSTPQMPFADPTTGNPSNYSNAPIMRSEPLFGIPSANSSTSGNSISSTTSFNPFAVPTTGNVSTNLPTRRQGATSYHVSPRNANAVSSTSSPRTDRVPVHLPVTRNVVDYDTTTTTTSPTSETFFEGPRRRVRRGGRVVVPRLIAHRRLSSDFVSSNSNDSSSGLGGFLRHMESQMANNDNANRQSQPSSSSNTSNSSVQPPSSSNVSSSAPIRPTSNISSSISRQASFNTTNSNAEPLDLRSTISNLPPVGFNSSNVDTAGQASIFNASNFNSNPQHSESLFIPASSPKRTDSGTRILNKPKRVRSSGMLNLSQAGPSNISSPNYTPRGDQSTAPNSSPTRSLSSCESINISPNSDYSDFGRITPPNRSVASRRFRRIITQNVSLIEHGMEHSVPPYRNNQNNDEVN